MAYIRIDFKSEALMMNTSAIVILPEDEKRMEEHNVVYLLHGLSDNATAWIRHTGIERYAKEHGLAVVMPEVQRSFYTDMAYGRNYFQYVSSELPLLMRRFFSLSGEKEKNYVMGLSMGGYGAVKFALRCPENYQGAASFSGALDIARRYESDDVMKKEELFAIFGNQVPSKDNLVSLIGGSDSNLPEIFLTCGEEDPLIRDTKLVLDLLEKKNAQVTFKMLSGTHEWKVWDESVMLAFNHFFASGK